MQSIWPGIVALFVAIAIAYGAMALLSGVLGAQRQKSKRWAVRGSAGTAQLPTDAVAESAEPSSGVAAADSDGQRALIQRYHRLRDDYHIQQKILEVSYAILAGGGSVATMEEAFALTLAACQQAFGGETSVIELYDADRQELIGVATDRQAYNPDGYFRIPIQESALSSLAFNGGRTVSITDVINDPRVSQRIRRFFNARSGIATPLIVDNKPIGVLMTMMQQVHQEFTARDHSLLEGLAAVASLAVHTQLLQRSRVQAEQRFVRLLEVAPVSILVVDDALRILEANKTSTAMFGFKPDALIGKNLTDYFNGAHPLRSGAWSGGDSAAKLEFEVEFGGAVGAIPVEVSASQLSLSGKWVTQVFLRDIRMRRAAEKALREEKTRAEITLRSISDAVISTDAEGRIETMNVAAERLLAITLKDAAGKPLIEALRVENAATGDALRDPAVACLHTNEVIDLTDVWVATRADGSKATVELSTAPIRDSDAQPIGTVTVIHDVTQAHKMAQEMSYLASHDNLTGLANRVEFELRLRRAIAQAQTSVRIHALCFIDLDRFKMVNDTCGHVAGDELLKRLSEKLLVVIRDSDTLARLGGDEFGLLLENCPITKAVEIAERLRALVKDFRFFWDGKVFDIGASIGVCTIDEHSGDLKEVMHAADAACYLAKEQGRNRVRVYTAEDAELAEQAGQAHWGHRIQQALADNQFVLFAQPILPLSERAGGTPHAEILVRMLDEQDQLVLPGTFLQAAERYQLMPKLDRWVVDCALDTIAALGPADATIYSINLSGQTLSDNETLDYLHVRIVASGIDPSRLCFEITETAAISNLTSALNCIHKLKRIGCRFALDDFGSGFNSFGYLKNLPVDYLKIDGEFIKDIHERPVDYAMVEAINKIGHVMNIQTIAEFVADEQVVLALKRIGVDFGQGYGLGKPMPWSGSVRDRRA